MALAYLLSPTFQVENSAGKPATGGWLEVFVSGSRDPYYCYSDFQGNLHPFKIPLDSLGSNVVLADDGHAYDVYVYNRYGSLLMSRYNVKPGHGAGGGGGTITSSDGSIDVTMTSTGYDLKVNGQEASALRAGANDLTSDGQFVFYELVRDGDHVTVDANGKIRLQDGWYHYDITARIKWVDGVTLENTESHVQLYTTLNSDIVPFDCTYEHEDTLHLHGQVKNTTGGSQFVVGVQGIATGMVIELVDCGIFAITGHGSAAEYEAGTGIIIDDHEISVDPTVIQEKLTPGDYVEITEENVINVTGVQPSGDYVSSSEMTAYQPVGDYVSSSELANYQTTAGMTAYQPSGNYVSSSDMSAYQTTADMTGYLPVSASSELFTGVNTDESMSGNGLSGSPLGVVRKELYFQEPLYTATVDDSAIVGFHTSILSGYQPSGNYVSSSDMSAYQQTADMTGYIPVSASSEFMPATASAGLFTGVHTDSSLTGVGVSSSELGINTAILSGFMPESASSEFMPATATGLFSGVETDTSLTGNGLSSSPLGLDTSILTGYQPSGDYVDNSTYTAYTANVDSSITNINNNITSIESSITNIESSISGLTGTYVEQSSFTGYTASADTEFVHTGDMSAYQPSGDYVSSSELSAYQPISAMTGYLPESASSELFTGVNTDTSLTGNGLSSSPLGLDTSILTGYQPSGNYVSSSELSAYQPVSAMTAYQPSGDYVSSSELSAYQPSGDYVSSSELANYQPSGNYVSSSEMSAYQPVSAMTAYQPSGDYVSSSELSAYQPSGDYVSSSELSAYQPVSAMTAYIPESASSSFMPASATGLFSGVDTDSSLTGNGLSSSPLGLDTSILTSYQQTADMTGYLPSSASSDFMPTSSATAFMPASANPFTGVVTDNSLTGNGLSGYPLGVDQIPLDTDGSIYTSMQTSVSGNTAIIGVNTAILSGYLPESASSSFITSTAGLATTSDLENYQPTSSMGAYQTTADMTSYVPYSAINFVEV